MAVLYVAEFSTLGGTGNYPVQGAQVPPLAEQTVTISGSSVLIANGFGTNTYFVRLHCDAICSVAFTAATLGTFGTTVTATVGNMRLAEGQTEYFAVSPTQKIAVITNT